ncbi:TonB-dependent receptor plug domain-containing protein [Sphingobacterium sp. T2]|uniref:TonB-dependent receptor n=1 Tax=Sphingobacterium sp. T2 TaxID=1590596 RepID=UPI00057B8EB4|nr:TonB-dependent receptor plug domain-containing protein [Sphingobacterium sp. T2]
MLTRAKRRRLSLAVLLTLASSHILIGQTQKSKNNFTIQGKVYEHRDGKLIPLRQASISIREYGIITTSSSDGSFSLKNVPTGSINLIGTYIGKQEIDTILNVKQNITLNLIFRDNSFRIDEVDVVAKRSNNLVGTSSKISSNAIEHLQANSLADVMSLLPGGLTSNSDLNTAKQINIRNVVNTSSNINAFGTSIIINGAPTSNNANLQALNPTVSGSAVSLAGGASPSGGFDVRNISLQNVESIEVVRGIPSVTYGDATSGTVIVNQKAGAQPLTIEARTNPNIYSLNITDGILLRNNKGALNIGGGYAYNINDPVQSYRYYQRATFNALYSNKLFGDRLNSTSGIDVNFGKDTRKLNPDDEITKTKSHAKEIGFSLHTKGNVTFDNKSLKYIQYSGKIGYTNKYSYLQEQYTSANAPYSMTYTDRAVLTNFPGRKFYDVEGKEITNIPVGEEHLYAVYLPSTYVGEYTIDGKELNAFVQTSANFFNRIGNTNHSWRFGADYKIDKNFGDGKIFADSLPPYRNLSYVNATFRKRRYKDIPALQQFGLFFEEDFSMLIANRKLNIIGGVRYDLFNGDKSVLSPRVNASYEVIPRTFSIKGGYGLLAKAPSLLYLSPEDAYFEYININELANTAIPEAERVFMTTTRVFSTENKNLKIAQNRKAELGFDFNIGKSSLSVTAFREKLENGYNYRVTAKPVEFIEYKRVNNNEPIYSAISNPVLAKFNMPGNGARLDKEGIEFELFLKRFDAIRTQFSINGMYINQKTYSSDYVTYDGQSGTGASSRTHIALYEPKMTVLNEKSTVSSLRTIHNIPSIGFVVTLTTEFIWNESDWTTYGNDSIPIKYISKIDGQIYDFDPSRKDESEFKVLLRPVSRTLETVESLPTMVNFNLNLTKEIRDYIRVSFFANNIFRYYQIAQSDRVKSNYYKRNIPYYFGLNLAVKLK